MLNPALAAPDCCTLVFDVDEQRYLFISNGFSLIFDTEVSVLQQNPEFLNKPLNSSDRERVAGLQINQTATLKYQVTTSNGSVKSIIEKRSAAIDELTGHRVIIHLLEEYRAGEAASDAAQEEAMLIKNSLEALINNTHDQIWSVDSKQRYLYMNQAYIKQITYLTGTVPKKGDYSYLHTGYSQQIIDTWNAYYQRALAGDRYAIISESPDPLTGNPLFFEVSFNPIYTEAGSIIGVGCFAHDITPRLKIEQELLDQNERLRNIASLSSHELRRPVASMMGLINLMDRKNFYNPENKPIIEHLLTVSTEIDDVIRLIVDSTFTGNLSSDQE